MIPETRVDKGANAGTGGSLRPGFRAPLNRQLIPIGEAGRRTVRKVFPVDQAAALEHERRALELAKGPGIPSVVGHGEDYLEIAWLGDEDLRMRVGREGPLPAAVVIVIARQTAMTLRRLHALPLVHGDVKPANLIVAEDGDVFLVDLENAVFGPSRDGETHLEARFTGGTYGYAPPEAYLGRAVDSGFDLYGLGATLHYLLTGFTPRQVDGGDADLRLLMRLRPALPAELRSLVEDLLCPDAASRPSAAEVVRRLDGMDASECADLERDLLAGRRSATPRHVSAAALRGHWRLRLERVLAALPPTPHDLDASSQVEAALRFCRAIHLCSSFVPMLPAARERLERARRRLPELLGLLPGEVQRLRAQMELEQARHITRLSLSLCRIVALLGMTDREAPQVIESTGYALQSALRRIEHEDTRQRAILGRIEQAEAALDLTGAQGALEELLESFSGSNANTARVRDRHQRFLWLLERAACGRVAVDECCGILDTGAASSAPVLRDWLGRASTALGKVKAPQNRSLGLLGRILRELSDGYPKLGLRAAVAEVDDLRLRLSDRAIDLLDSIASRLQIDPVPLRPLLRDLRQVDRILLLDCLVDTERLLRAELLDRLEQLRLRVEEVADKHNRIARGAREQMEQGRLTTALYDLERALKASSQAGDVDAEQYTDEALRRELARVRKLKVDLGNATCRNLELRDLHARLVDRNDGGFDVRLRCLEQRESVLGFLIEHGPMSFRARYVGELEEVHVDRCIDLSDQAEQRLLASKDPEHQLKIATTMLEEISETVDPQRSGAERGGRTAALITRWQGYQDRAEGDTKAQSKARAKQQRRRRWWRGAAVAASVLAVAAGLHLLTRNGAAATIAERAARISNEADVMKLIDTTEPGPAVRASLGLLARSYGLATAYRRMPNSANRDRLGDSLSNLRRSVEALPAVQADLARVLRQHVTRLRDGAGLQRD